jgi:urea transport system ATP-binding protein
MHAMGNLLEVKKLGVNFDGFQAIDDISLKVAEGELRVIIGPNGAGKSTLMDVITGKTKPSVGKVFMRGSNITGLSPNVLSGKYKIGRKFQGPNVFENMSVYETIEIALSGYTSIISSFLYRRNRTMKKLIQENLEMIGLEDQSETMASELSHGQRQWLEIGMVIAQCPDLIILDEPTAGMTVEETYKTGEMIKALLDRHTVIVVEHDMDFVKQVANTVTVLHQGRLLAEGPYEEIEKNQRVVQVYLKSDN